jgi:predicted glycoside hydrolase/deacetylase ChbG (UPF0249 family)
VTRLILNADDFGLTPGVNQSIFDLQNAGALTSTTLMANAANTDDAVAGAAQHPALGVGCHVVLTDGTPVLPPSSIPALAPANGDFRPSLAAFVRDLLRGNIPEVEIEKEVTAQIQRLQAAGVRVTHLDTHKHTHLFPRVLRPLLRAAVHCGVGAIRNPCEPDWAISATPAAPALRRTQVRLLRMFNPQFPRQVREAGLATPDGAIGLVATGTLDADALRALLQAMPNGTWELVCHPGYPDAALDKVRTRLRGSRAVEHAALLETVPGFLRDHIGIESSTFRDLSERNV